MPSRSSKEIAIQAELLGSLCENPVEDNRCTVVQERSFAEFLEQAVRQYHNRAIETVQIIDDLIGLARDVPNASMRAELLHLSEDELAPSDALETASILALSLRYAHVRPHHQVALEASGRHFGRRAVAGLGSSFRDAT